jgi:hypothetical protein
MRWGTGGEERGRRPSYLFTECIVCTLLWKAVIEQQGRKIFLFTDIPFNSRRRGSVAECLNHPWIAPKSVGDIRLRQSNQINMDNFRNFQVFTPATALSAS